MKNVPDHLPISLADSAWLALLVLLVLVGLALQFSDWVEPRQWLLGAKSLADHWWMAPALVLLQAVLFTLALPGSLILWVTAPLYPPATATAILVAGGTLGAVGAYLFSGRLAASWVARHDQSPVYLMLREHNSFLSLFALRLMPGFPNSVINYSAGVLKTRLRDFIPAAILALSFKYYLYSHAIYNATSAASSRDLLDLDVIGPLTLLSALAIAGVVTQYRLRKRRNH